MHTPAGRRGYSTTKPIWTPKSEVSRDSRKCRVTLNSSNPNHPFNRLSTYRVVQFPAHFVPMFSEIWEAGWSRLNFTSETEFTQASSPCISPDGWQTLPENLVFPGAVGWAALPRGTGLHSSTIELAGCRILRCVKGSDFDVRLAQASVLRLIPSHSLLGIFFFWSRE
jgi:hypothetical protein